MLSCFSGDPTENSYAAPASLSRSKLLREFLISNYRLHIHCVFINRSSFLVRKRAWKKPIIRWATFMVIPRRITTWRSAIMLEASFCAWSWSSNSGRQSLRDYDNRVRFSEKICTKKAQPMPSCFSGELCEVEIERNLYWTTWGIQLHESYNSDRVHSCLE